MKEKKQQKEMTRKSIRKRTRRKKKTSTRKIKEGEWKGEEREKGRRKE